MWRCNIMSRFEGEQKFLVLVVPVEKLMQASRAHSNLPTRPAPLLLFGLRQAHHLFRAACSPVFEVELRTRPYPRSAVILLRMMMTL